MLYDISATIVVHNLVDCLPISMTEWWCITGTVSIGLAEKSKRVLQRSTKHAPVLMSYPDLETRLSCFQIEPYNVWLEFSTTRLKLSRVCCTKRVTGWSEHSEH